MRKESLSLRGVFPALVTPFDPKTEEVDEEAFRRLIRHVLPYVDGVVTSGTTGEFPYLTREEQRRLVEIAREEVGAHGSAPNAGAHGGAPNAGAHGSAPNVGAHGSAPNAGAHGNAPNAGARGGAPNAGARGGAPNAGAHGNAPNAGAHGSAPNVGAHSSAPNAGAHGSAPLVIAGCGASGTPEALALARDAREAGADAILVVTPYFLHPSDKEVYQHFYDIATQVDIPLILYNIPQVVDAVLPREVVEDLADLPNVVGLKDSSGNLTYTMEILEYAGDRIDVLIGHDEVVVPALAGGVRGMILASAQVYPEVWQEVLRLVEEGRLAEARALQRKVQKLSRIFCRYGGGVAVKAALNMMGIPVGNPRRPLKAVGGALIHETRAEIQLELERLGKIQVEEEPFEYPGGPLEARFGDLELTPEVIRAHHLRVGSGAAGEGLNRVQLDLVAGRKGTPLGEAYALQLTYPLHGREALTTILEPGLTVRPFTLLLPTLPQKNLRQANMIYGPTQSALARAIVDALEAGAIPESAVDEEVMIVLATVHPKALDRRALYHSVYEAARAAIAQAFVAQD